ncbi:MAG: pyridoxal-phosphate dependent enzyme [Candidatus Eisenbacteria bacterium]|nr:pyridoxal-phosphate dependent enzyme [Candidatus Eisenbacteria bacterium]
MSADPTFADVRAAAERIADRAHRTPILTCRTLDASTGQRLFFKCENFQKVGAFKFRGASNAVLCLSDAEARQGVITHSSGNHAAALALAARMRGIPATVVMPRTASRIKREAVAGYGAEIIPCEPTLESRETTAAERIAQTGATFIHPYDDPRIIAGAGTAALELLEDVASLDLLLTPIGGGGLTSGSALAVSGLSPDTDLIAVEPAGADDAYRSLRAGRRIPQTDPRTIADGLLTSLSERTFRLIRAHAREIVTVSDDAIVGAMRRIWERMKIVVEPSAAVPLAALLEEKIPTRYRRIGIILSGGNVDLDHLPWTEAAPR